MKIFVSAAVISVLLLGTAITFLPVHAAPMQFAAPKKLRKDAKNVNKASFDDLTNVSSLNPSLARDMVDGRPWKSLQDLVNRKGYFDLGDQKALKKAIESGEIFVK